MKITAPDYYSAFSCLCGNCPDTCCIGWEVVVDEKSLPKYQSLPGPLGDKLRSVLQYTDGEPNFRLQSGGRCPFLMESGLCQMQATLGEDILCRTCRLFPRIFWESGDRREITLSLSCPEAARLILTHQGPISFVQTETSEPISCFHDLDADWYLFLLDMRKILFAIAQDRSLPMGQRMALCLQMSAQLQKALRNGEDETVLLAQWQDPSFRQSQLASLPRPSLSAMNSLLPLLSSMERLTPRWDQMLTLMSQPSNPQYDAPEEEYEHIFIYYLFRYFMESAFDGNPYLQVKTAVVCLCLIRHLFRCQPTPPTQAERIDLAHLFSREVEHSADNMAALQNALRHVNLGSCRRLLPLCLI